MSDTESNVLLNHFNFEEELNKIDKGIKGALRSLRKRGVVVAISGGIDSSVTAAICAKAIGSSKVFGLLLPENDSSSSSESLGKVLAEHIGIEYLTHDIGSALEAIGCYQWRDDAIRKIFPEYTEEWKNKIAIVSGDNSISSQFKLIVQSPDGVTQEKKMGLKEYLQIVAATSYKQRTRKMVEYFHADRLNYAVTGTPNRLEYDQGFFVKNGDGAADLKPIAHLYKTQVYAMARYLELPENICSTIPTTDTYSLEQGQDEFYFSLPYQKMDIALWHVNNGKSTAELASALSIEEHQAKIISDDIHNKRRTTAPLHWSPILMEPVTGPIAKN